MATNIGLNNSNQAVVIALAKLLADEYVLYTKTRNAHWNVEGPDFYDKHKFFESQYEQLDDFIDEIAERIRTLGHYAPATLADFLKLTRLTEKTRTRNNSSGFITELLVDHENIIMILRGLITTFVEENGDIGTIDFITNLMEDHEKMAWFLRAHLDLH
jgi:starvation-inducible DNA-binding protein